MTVVWSFLLRWTRVISGTFSPTEVAMTLVVGAAVVPGLVAAARDRCSASVGRACTVMFGVLVFQLAAFGLSFRPVIVHDPRSRPAARDVSR